MSDHAHQTPNKNTTAPPEIDLLSCVLARARDRIVAVDDGFDLIIRGTDGIYRWLNPVKADRGRGDLAAIANGCVKAARKDLKDRTPQGQKVEYPDWMGRSGKVSPGAVKVLAHDLHSEAREGNSRSPMWFVSSDDINRTPMLKLPKGAVNLQNNEVLTPKGMAPHYMMDPGKAAFPLDKGNPDDYDWLAMARHYGGSRGPEHYLLRLRRLALNILRMGYGKAIDAIVMWNADAGKSSHIAYEKQALGGIIQSIAATKAFGKSGDPRFNRHSLLVIKALVVYCDEADKMDPPSPGVVNLMTDPDQDYEKKGIDASQGRRTATTTFIGANYPNFSMHQGLVARVGQVWESDAGIMPYEMRHAMFSDDGLAWLRKTICEYAADLTMNYAPHGRDRNRDEWGTINADTIASRDAFFESILEPIEVALRSLCVADPGNFLPSKDLHAALTEADIDPKIMRSSKVSMHWQNAVGIAGIKSTQQQRVWGYPNVALR